MMSKSTEPHNNETIFVNLLISLGVKYKVDKPSSKESPYTITYTLIGITPNSFERTLLPKDKYFFDIKFGGFIGAINSN